MNWYYYTLYYKSSFNDLRNEHLLNSFYILNNLQNKTSIIFISFYNLFMYIIINFLFFYNQLLKQ